jgi:DNA-binding MarR family transcriptional regulator
MTQTVKGSEAEDIRARAEELEQLLPSVFRRIFTYASDSPTNELPVAQLRICTLLQFEHRTLSSIAEELGISVSATTQSADRLEKAGMVARVPGLDDRRTRYLQLTPHGAEIMRARREQRIERARRVLERFTPEERDRLVEALNTLKRVALECLPPRIEGGSETSEG